MTAPATDARFLARVASALRTGAASVWAGSGDLAVGVVSQAGTLVMADGAPARHVMACGAIANAVRRRFAARLDPGDLVVHNDPYTGGTSLVDLTVVAVAGDGEERRYGMARLRTVDAGGGEPGGVFPPAHQVIQEGDRVPPVRIAERGRLLGDLVRRLAVNTRRRSAYERDLVALCTAARAATRAAITDAGPAGASGTVDGEGSATLVVQGSLLRSPRRIRARVVARDGRFEVDFTGTDTADAGPGNVPWSATTSSALEALRAATGSAEPIEALAQRVTWSAAEGSLVRPAFPSACGAGGLYTGFAVREVVARALAALGLPKVEWATWTGGAVLSGPPAAEYATLVPLDAPGALESLAGTVPGVRFEVAGRDRCGRQVRVEGPTDGGLRLTSWRMEIDGEGPEATIGPSLRRAALPATLWLPELR